MYMRFSLDNLAQSEIMSSIADGTDNTASHWTILLVRGFVIVQAGTCSMAVASG
jgi:hypothetical protein